jgi:hypothetical protein
MTQKVIRTSRSAPIPAQGTQAARLLDKRRLRH